MQLKSLIIEDEKRSAKLLEKLVSEYCESIDLLGIAYTVPEALKLIQNTNPDLIFLDIEMQSETGFDLLKQIENKKMAVIFTTAYEKYALQAIKFSASDYLMKPIDVNELISAVAKVENNLNDKKLNSAVDVLLYNLNNRNSGSQKIVLSTSEGLHIVMVTDIVYCESDGPYTTFFLGNGKTIVISKHLKEYENMLTPFGFFRIHNSFLVNLSEVKKYIRGEGGQVEMKNGSMLNVSKSRKDDFLKIINHI